MTKAIEKTTEAEIEARLNRARVLRMIYEGTGDEAAAEFLGLRLDRYLALKEEAISEEGRRISTLKVEEVYAEYLIQMRRIISDLIRVRRMAVRARSFGAAVTALKTAGEMLDKSIARGQEMGVIVSPTKTVKHLHAHVVAQLDSPSLRASIIHEVDAMRRLVGSTGDGDILDVEAESVIEADLIEVDSFEAPEPTTKPEGVGARSVEGKGRPGFAKGGAAKAAGGKAVRKKRRESKRPERDDIEALLDG